MVKGLAGFAITDHKTLNGFKYLRKRVKDLLIIPGMEVETEIGEVIGLFISEELDTRKKDYFEVIDDIKSKNGIVIVPHPFDKLRSNHLKVDLIPDVHIKNTIQGVEIVNARIIQKKYIEEARQFQQFFNLIKTGGSDAHTNGEVGNAYTFIPTEDPKALLNEDELKRKLLEKKSESYGKQSNPMVHAITVATKWKNNLFKAKK